MTTLNFSKLNNNEKIELISEIHDSMDNIEVSDAIKIVLEERLKRIENGTAKFLTFDQLKTRIDQLK